jgi:hypothetical protein
MSRGPSLSARPVSSGVLAGRALREYTEPKGEG